MRPFTSDGHLLPLRAVRAAMGAGAPEMVLEEVVTTEWASATFVGRRHRIAVRLEGAPGIVLQAVERLRVGLAGADVATDLHFLADAELTDVHLESDGGVAAVVVDALTIEC